MKTQVSLLVIAALMMSGVAYAGRCNGNCANGGTTIKTYTTIKYDSGCSSYDCSNNVKPVVYKSNGNKSDLYSNNVEKPVAKSKSYVSSQERKYYLAHPFFQPLQFRVGSVTDFAYNYNAYDISFGGNGQTVYLKDRPGTFRSFDGESGNWKYNSFSIKEDLSFGITDRIALVGMLRYESGDSKYDWSNGSKDSNSNNGLNMWGLGIQGRFVDTNEWIATGSLYYERQKDVSNDFILELKAGYKISRSTIYGIGRAWFINYDGNVYGNYAAGKDNGYNSEILLAYRSDVSNGFYGEIGFGDFSVLAEDWTFNIEGLFGHYDWHNQLSAKLALGWQPNDWFALNLYGRAALYDDAKDKNVDVYYSRENMFLDAAYTKPAVGFFPMGNANLKNYKEYSVGLQAIFMF